MELFLPSFLYLFNKLFVNYYVCMYTSNLATEFSSTSSGQSGFKFGMEMLLTTIQSDCTNKYTCMEIVQQ